MKYLKNALLAWCVIFCVVAITGCNRHGPGSYKNDEIDAAIREDFHEMNEVLLEGVKSNRPKMIERIMSKAMLEDVSINRVVELTSVHLRKGNATMLDEFYMVHEFNRDNKIKATNHGVNNYTLTYTPTAREMYVAFYIIKDGLDQWMLSAVYNKLNYGWKLCELELNPYSLTGRTAPELYELAKRQYAKGYLIDAVCTMNMCRSYSNPNAMVIYEQLSVMDDFYSKVIKEAEDKYSKTIVLKQVTTQPYIFRVFNQNTSAGSFPMVYYMSKINLQDTAGIKQEFVAVKKNIGKVLPGINQDKKLLFYSVFSQKSGTKNLYRYHLEFTDTLK